MKRFFNRKLSGIAVCYYSFNLFKCTQVLNFTFFHFSISVFPACFSAFYGGNLDLYVSEYPPIRINVIRITLSGNISS